MPAAFATVRAVFRLPALGRLVPAFLAFSIAEWGSWIGLVVYPAPGQAGTSGGQGRPMLTDSGGESLPGRIGRGGPRCRDHLALGDIDEDLRPSGTGGLHGSTEEEPVVG
jgi:hypothetical protein